jgi:hypothetical protein
MNAAIQKRSGSVNNPNRDCSEKKEELELSIIKGRKDMSVLEEEEENGDNFSPFMRNNSIKEGITELNIDDLM